MGKRKVEGRMPDAPAVAVGDLAGLAPESLQMLLQAGIGDRGRLEALGSVGAYIEVHRRGLKPSLNFLYALEGVIRDTPWTSLPYHVRASLTLEADAMLAADDER